ncbi:MAG: 4Fe-4S dicluster domain-containing protein [Candidatus Thorarchaeota archaeon]
MIEKCIACGVCTASCAIASSTQYNPRQVIQKILVGAKDVVLESDQPWLCKTCHLCESTCQHGITLADVFEIVRKFAIKEGFVQPAFLKVTHTILMDGWMQKCAYSDFVADERKQLGLSSRLTWNKRYTKRVKSKYLENGG